MFCIDNFKKKTTVHIAHNGIPEIALTHMHKRTFFNKILHKNNNKRNRLGWWQWQKMKRLEKSQKKWGKGQRGWRAPCLNNLCFETHFPRIWIEQSNIWLWAYYSTFEHFGRILIQIQIYRKLILRFDLLYLKIYLISTFIWY